MMNLRFGGAAMALGGFLFIARIGPVVVVKPEDVGFPPETTAELVRLATASGGAWPAAHIAGLVAAALMIFAYWKHANVLAAAGRPTVGRAAAFAAAAAFGLFSAALIIDGFVVYAAALASAAAPDNAQLLTSVAEAHARALFFFTPALFTMFIAMGILASRMIHGYLHSRWLGWLGQVIAVLAITAFLTGVAGPNWSNLQIGGSATLAGFVWHIFVGLAALFGRGVRQ